MCGIAGIIRKDGAPVDRALLSRMIQAIKHRGPDGEGFYFTEPAEQAGWANIGFGHCRLAIIDLAGGHQPMCNEDHSIWVVCNGEIYNYVELRRQLEAKGHRFASNSDTEVIVHQYEEDGVDCVKAFRGMFAFAVWDQKAMRLLLARDRLGKKPLWYTANPNRLLFASEPQGLLADPSVKREVNPQALDAYLTYGYVPSPQSIFTGISKVMPAHRIIWDQRGVRSERYWQLDYEPKNLIAEQEVEERFLELFRESVRIRLRSDVPVGAFLSGGLDSSSVVAVASSLSQNPVRTFSIGFEDGAYSELAYAREVARHFNTKHCEFVVKPQAASVVTQLAVHYGEPYADSSCIPTFYVAQQTKQHVTVALSGDGGDESFAGYTRYQGAALAQRLERVPKSTVKFFCRVLNMLGSSGRGSTTRRLDQLNRFLQALAECPSPENRYLRWIGFFLYGERQDFYTPAFRAQLNGSRSEAYLSDLYHRSASASVIERLMAVDVGSYLPEDLLVKVDIASMAHALEVRSPLLDHVLMEFVARLPLRYKVRGFTSKYLLRKVMTPVLPPSILKRSKMGFGIPLGRWLAQDLNSWMRQILLDPQTLRRGIFRGDVVERLIAEHTTGTHDHRFRLWALIMLELWYQSVLEAHLVPSTAEPVSS